VSLIQRLKERSIEKDAVILGQSLDYNPIAKLLDVGCGDGKRTMRWAKVIGTEDVTGLDAKDFGVPFRLIEGRVDKGFPLADESFDVIITHHVIEHVADTDLFVSELYRVLRRGGYAIVATPNMASGLLIAELILNKQPKWAHVSDFFFVRGYSHKGGYSDRLLQKHIGFLHRRLFTLQGLGAILTHYGFKVEYTRRFGYGAILGGGILGGLYAANILVKARRY